MSFLKKLHLEQHTQLTCFATFSCKPQFKALTEMLMTVHSALRTLQHAHKEWHELNQGIPYLMPVSVAFACVPLSAPALLSCAFVASYTNFKSLHKGFTKLQGAQAMPLARHSGLAAVAA